MAADTYEIIKYHYLHFPDEETVTFEKEVIKIIKNSNPSLVFSHRKHFLMLYTTACEYHCSLPNEVMIKTWIVQYCLPWASVRKDFTNQEMLLMKRQTLLILKLMVLPKVLSFVSHSSKLKT